MNLDLLQAMIKKHFSSFNYLSSKSGDEGIETARGFLPEIILLDVSMPVMSGFEVCEILKQDQRTRDIPVLMVTALGQDVNVRIKSLDSGADTIISKPYNPLELIAMIKVLLRVKKSEGELKTQNLRLRENVRMVKSYQAKLKELNQELLKVEELEKKRIADFLHDDIAQKLSLANLSLGAILMNNGDDQRNQHIARVSTLIRDSISACRSMIYDLHLPVLNELGLVHALKWKLENIRRQFNIQYKIVSNIDEGTLNPGQYTLLYRVFLELLNNCIKHSRASLVVVKLKKVNGHYEFSVHDNGVGIPNLSTGSFSSTKKFGLLRVRERLSAVNGILEIEAKKMKGSRIRFIIPAKEIANEN